MYAKAQETLYYGEHERLHGKLPAEIYRQETSRETEWHQEGVRTFADVRIGDRGPEEGVMDFLFRGWAIHACRFCVWWRRSSYGAGWSIETPLSSRGFSERMGFKKPVFRFASFRVFPLKATTYES